jgi:hypothetical protein
MSDTNKALTDKQIEKVKEDVTILDTAVSVLMMTNVDQIRSLTKFIKQMSK